MCSFLQPTTLVSLPPGIMLLNHSTTPRDSATNIEKISRKGAPEWERPNRSVIKKKKAASKRSLNYKLRVWGKYGVFEKNMASKLWRVPRLHMPREKTCFGNNWPMYENRSDDMRSRHCHTSWNREYKILAKCDRYASRAMNWKETDTSLINHRDDRRLETKYGVKVTIQNSICDKFCVITE